MYRGSVVTDEQRPIQIGCLLPYDGEPLTPNPRAFSKFISEFHYYTVKRR